MDNFKYEFSAGAQGRVVEKPAPIAYHLWTTAQLFNELCWANGTDVFSCDEEAVEELAKRIGLKRKEVWDVSGDWEEADG